MTWLAAKNTVKSKGWFIGRFNLISRSFIVVLILVLVPAFCLFNFEFILCLRARLLGDELPAVVEQSGKYTLIGRNHQRSYESFLNVSVKCPPGREHPSSQKLGLTNGAIEELNSGQQISVYVYERDCGMLAPNNMFDLNCTYRVIFQIIGLILLISFIVFRVSKTLPTS